MLVHTSIKNKNKLELNIRKIFNNFRNLSALDNTIKYNKSKLSNYKSLDQRFDETR